MALTVDLEQREVMNIISALANAVAIMESMDKGSRPEPIYEESRALGEALLKAAIRGVDEKVYFNGIVEKVLAAQKFAEN